MRYAALLLAGALTPLPALAAPQLDAAWSDHAVIQRGQPIVIEGSAPPRSEIMATLGTETWRGRADREGRFAAQFAAREASADPLVLTVADGSGTATVTDMLVGDVWLCSGQSNMEWPLSASTAGGGAIQGSADAGLRLLQVPKDTAPAPQRAFSTPVAWVAASPESTPAFSAACYYMARELRRSLGVPIGAIHSSWGGSQVRAWLSPEAGRNLYGAEQMALLDEFRDDPLAAVTAFMPTWEAWWRAGTGQEPWKDPSAVQWMPVPRISHWGEWAGTPLAGNGVGNVLLRRTITLTPEQAAAGGTLGIGVIDDLDATWINGRPLGVTHGWSAERHYRVPPGYLKAGDNEVLVVASNSWGSGGFTTGADRLFFAVEGGEQMSLAEGWQYSIGQLSQMPPRAPWDANAGIGVMHNKMIAPLGRIGLKGAAWYQGESDVGIPGYAGRLSELFAGWRRQFGPQAQMLVVQLPNYGEVTETPVAAGWAELREQQRQAVAADAHAALVTTLDVGENDDLHPPDKRQVGLRLAAAGQGQPMPLPWIASVNNGTVTVEFRGLEGGLHAWSGRPLGVELCGDTQESCRYAAAATSGDTLLVVGDDKPVTRVRYAWADSPVINLYDGRKLPIPTFELPIQAR
ncbi:MAG TPA: sialate O-acetylesterase [Croceibacterium sp.]|nr:sialate O-acetylesterase [Croceibacterium sp.]